MASKRGPNPHRPFESKTKTGKFTKICDDMCNTPAWNALNRSQRYLYFEFKKRYVPKYINKVLVSDNANNISIPASEAKKLYSDLRTFRADVDRLIECGFINLIEGGWTTRTANIYGFSDRWQKYGQPDYEVPAQVKRPKRMKAAFDVAVDIKDEP